VASTARNHHSRNSCVPRAPAWVAWAAGPAGVAAGPCADSATAEVATVDGSQYTRAMAPSPYVHGSTDDTEVARLITQARFVASFSLADFDAAPGMHVLDLGTGVGAMSAMLAARYPGVQLTGLDFSEAQLERARKLHPVARYVQGDAAALPFEDAMFDRVHCTWVLEHVADPVRILREVRRVLKPGGYAHVMEVDNATLKIEPPLPGFTQTFDAMNSAQMRAGGDPFIGQVLERHFRDAGFEHVQMRQVPLHGHAEEPAFYAEMLEEFAAICESIDEVLTAAEVKRARIAATALRARAGQPNSSLEYTPMLARATR
jgi:ubiquinone/menaquinone biosynthesis C-methylase UbiE